MQLTLKVNDQELEARMKQFVELLGNWSAVWPGVAGTVHALIRGQFESAGSGAWLPLSPRYATRKAKKYPGQPLLRATDRLFASLTGESPESVFAESTKSVTLGSVVPYAAYSEWEEAGSGRAPRRAIFGFLQSSPEQSLGALAEPFERFARKVAIEVGWELADRGTDMTGAAPWVGSDGASLSAEI